MKLIVGAVALLLVVVYAQAEACVDRYKHCNLVMARNYCVRKMRYSKYWCAKTCGFCGGEGTAPKPAQSCGKPEIQGQRVVAGITATRGSWPWQILMSYMGQASCGGAIIGPRHVVTAAHCVKR